MIDDDISIAQQAEIHLPDEGCLYLGAISPEMATALHKASTANPLLEPDLYVNSKEFDPFDPTPPQDRGDTWFNFNEVNVDYLNSNLAGFSDFLNNLIPIERIVYSYLKCDVMSLHEDSSVNNIQHPGSVIILLDAPRGCRLVTGATNERILEVGDCLLIDDRLLHGAYPLEKPEHVCRVALEAQSEDDVIAFNDRNCLSFLIVASAVEEKGDSSEFEVSPFDEISGP